MSELHLGQRPRRRVSPAEVASAENKVERCRNCSRCQTLLRSKAGGTAVRTQCWLHGKHPSVNGSPRLPCPNATNDKNTHTRVHGRATQLSLLCCIEWSGIQRNIRSICFLSLSPCPDRPHRPPAVHLGDSLCRRGLSQETTATCPPRWVALFLRGGRRVLDLESFFVFFSLTRCAAIDPTRRTCARIERRLFHGQA